MPLLDGIRSFFGNDRSKVLPPLFSNFSIFEGDSHLDEEFHDQHRFGIFSGDVTEIHRYLEQQLDDIIKNLHPDILFSGFQDGSMLGPPEDDNLLDDNPCNKFLKPGYIQPPSFSSSSDPSADKELTETVSPSRILDLFPDKGNSDVEHRKRTDVAQPFIGRTISAFSSQTIMKRVLPNGGVEEERKCIKNGKEEVTTSRQLNGMEHTVTTVKLPDGTTQTHEKFVNLDEEKLSDFNKAWSGKSFQRLALRDNNSLNEMPHGSLIGLLKHLF